jgi:hypothetical protein
VIGRVDVRCILAQRISGDRAGGGQRRHGRGVTQLGALGSAVGFDGGKLRLPLLFVEFQPRPPLRLDDGQAVVILPFGGGQLLLPIGVAFGGDLRPQQRFIRGDARFAPPK